MNTVYLHRQESTDEGTPSTLTFDTHTLNAMELPWRDNKPQHSCIPVGTYQCKVVTSPKFGKVYGVMDVPDRSNILIHSANFAGDTDLGFKSELLGCIAPCMSIGRLDANGKSQLAGLSSKNALAIFMALANDEPFTLIIS